MKMMMTVLMMSQMKMILPQREFLLS